MWFTLHILYQSMCGRVDRPSEPLWQMKVMLRRRGACRKAGNKQPDLWRTLKHTSERKQGGRMAEKNKWSEEGTELSGKELFANPHRAGPVSDQTAGYLSNARAAKLWGLNPAGRRSFQNHTWAQTRFKISKERPEADPRSTASECCLMSKKSSDQQLTPLYLNGWIKQGKVAGTSWQDDEI